MCGQRCQPRRELSRSQKVPCVLTTLPLCTRLCPERMLTPKDPGGIAKVPRAFVGPTVPRPPQPRPTAPPVGWNTLTLLRLSSPRPAPPSESLRRPPSRPHVYGPPTEPQTLRRTGTALRASRLVHATPPPPRRVLTGAPRFLLVRGRAEAWSGPPGAAGARTRFHASRGPGREAVCQRGRGHAGLGPAKPDARRDNGNCGKWGAWAARP